MDRGYLCVCMCVFLCVCVCVCVGAKPSKWGPVYIKKPKSEAPKKSEAPSQGPTFFRAYFCSFFNVIPQKSKIVQGPTFRVGSFTLETYTGTYFSGVLHTQGPTFRAPFFANWHCSGPMARQVKPKYISRLQCNFNVLK